MRKKGIVVALAAVLALCVLALAACGGAKGSAQMQTVNLKIDAAAAVEKGYPIEAALFEGEVQIPEGGTLFDALDASGLVYDGSGDYVSSIEGLAEAQFGGMSGWVFTVNGEYLMEGNPVLKPGDAVEFTYVLEFSF